MKRIIIAPHADDELIGCYSILEKYPGQCQVLFPNKQAFEEARMSAKMMDFERGNLRIYNPTKEALVYAPNPFTELHPLHRQLGMKVEEWLRTNQIKDAIFYSTNMNVPNIFEVQTAKKKESMLNEAYPQKKELWKYEHKYFLFEAYQKWIIL